MFRVTCIFVCLSVSNLRADDSISPPDRQRVLELLKDTEKLRARRDLVSMGAKILPVLWEECNDSEASAKKRTYIFAIVSSIPGDRERFVQLAAKDLPKKGQLLEIMVALNLIRSTKSKNYASDVGSLLKIPNDLLAVSVSETLAIIGSEKELILLDEWLKKDLRVESGPVRMGVRDGRDMLKERLQKDKR